jgi:hypothetical protein
MTPLEVCKYITGMDYEKARVFIINEGCVQRITYLNGKNYVELVTSDFSCNRINIQVEGGKIKKARIG